MATGMAPYRGPSGREAASEPPARGVEQHSHRHLGFGGRLKANLRGRLRWLADIGDNLSVRLLSRVLLFSACITLLLTLLQLFLEYRHEVSALELRLDEIGETNLDSLAERLWALDENQLRLQLGAILRLPDMRAVEVREGGSSRDPFVVSLGERSASSAIAREYPLLHDVRGQNTRIGTLYVQATLADIYHRQFHTALVIFANTAGAIFLVSLFMVYIFHHLVTRHLFAIATYVDSFGIDEPPLPLRLRRPSRKREDELQRVVTAFNAMSDNLIRDVTALRQAEGALREREARIRRLIDADIIGIFLWDIEGPMFEANEAFLRIVGYDREDLVSGRLRWTDMTPPDWRDRETQQLVPELKRTGRLQPYEKEFFRKDGSRVPVLIGSAIFEESTYQGVSFVLDLTERKRAEAERENLRQLQADLEHINRVTTLGELSASLSHELKQPIAAAIMNADACLLWLDRDEPDLQEMREAATEVIKEAKRAADIIDRLRSFYKKGVPPERVLVDVNEIVREMLGLLRGQANQYGIEMRTELAAELAGVTADRVQLQQVFMNLMLNGIEAMKDTGGELSIKSEPRPDGYLLISVSDTGVGLPVQKAGEIFSAFFTTKSQGSGMGLSISRSIVESYGGRIWAAANPGPGAVFHFTLPTQIIRQV